LIFLGETQKNILTKIEDTCINSAILKNNETGEYYMKRFKSVVKLLAVALFVAMVCLPAVTFAQAPAAAPAATSGAAAGAAAGAGIGAGTIAIGAAVVAAGLAVAAGSSGSSSSTATHTAVSH
jgi:hypothetical protein